MTTVIGNSVQGELTGTVSWFSNSKGYGFIKTSDGSEDIFVHISAVQGAGQHSLRDGTTVICETEPGRKGRQVARIIRIDETTATGPELPHPTGGGRGGRFTHNGAAATADDFGVGFSDADRQGAASGEGTIKWFNLTKGFGFISPTSGGRDVFLHASIVRRAGLHDVLPGQRVRFFAIEREKGPEARTLEIA